MMPSDTLVGNTGSFGDSNAQFCDAIPRNGKKKHVSKACTNCRKMHAACDQLRPCSRCSFHGMADTCVDVPRKKRTSKKLKEELAANGLSGAMMKRKDVSSDGLENKNGDWDTPFRMLPDYQGEGENQESNATSLLQFAQIIDAEPISSPMPFNFVEDEATRSELENARASVNDPNSIRCAISSQMASRRAFDGVKSANGYHHPANGNGGVPMPNIPPALASIISHNADASLQASFWFRECARLTKELSDLRESHNNLEKKVERLGQELADNKQRTQHIMQVFNSSLYAQQQPFVPANPAVYRS